MYSIDSIDEYIKKQKQLLAEEKERLKMIDDNIKKLTINKDEGKAIKKSNKNDDEKVPLKINQKTNNNNNIENNSKSDKTCDESNAACDKIDNKMKPDNKTYDEDKIFDNPFSCYEYLLAKSEQKGDNHNPERTNDNNALDKDTEVLQNKILNDNSKRKSIIEKENNNHQKIMKISKENSNKNEMDQWISDKFYSHFPSLNEGILNKKLLSHTRQLEYQEYLKRIPKNPSKKYNNKQLRKTISSESVNDEITINNNNNNDVNEVNKLETLNHSTGVNNIIEDNNTNLQQTNTIINDIEINKSIRKGSPRYRLLEDLITPNILNSDIVEERNKQEAAKKLNKKMEYQKELIKQIEDKRREIERLKERERIEEEALTKRLEDQLKTMELEEQLEMENIKSEKIRLNNEQNHLLRMQLLSKLNNDHKLYNPYGDRKTQSENGKDNLIDKTGKILDDRNIYKFFTNSARYNKNNFRKLSSSSSSEEILDSDVSLTDNLPSTTSTALKKPQTIINAKKDKCHYCNSNDEYCQKCNKYVITTIDKKLNICLICYKHLLLCNKCKMQTDICVNCLKYQHNGNNNMKIMCKYCYNYIKITGGNSDNRISHEQQPYSLNLDDNSIFNPNNKINEKKYSINIKNGNIFVDQVKENEISTNKRIEKLYENYDDLRKIRNNRKSTIQNYSHNPDKHIDYLLFNKGENLIKKKPLKHTQHAAFKTIEQKWDIPGTRRANVTENNPRILTQLGAIRKQLQLEQFEIDENTAYPSNSFRNK